MKPAKQLSQLRQQHQINMSVKTMIKRHKWSRRRGDNRKAKKSDYNLIQDVSSDTLNDDLSIPDFDASEVQKFEPEFDDMASVAPPLEPQIFAFMGATGGVGTTSLATQLAYEFAVSSSKRSRGLSPNDPSVCLIDLDFETGACGHHLDLLPSLTLADLTGPAEDIDEAFTRALISTHQSGISLLATPNEMGANAKVNPHTIMAILDAAMDLYDTVILDMPRHQQPWSMPIMQAVDLLGVTCELNIPSLHATREVLSYINREAQGKVNAHPIIGKYERRSFKNMLKLSDAEKALGQSVFATICQDPDTVREALNCGEPAGALKSDSRFEKDVRVIAARLRKVTNGAAELAA